MRNPFRFFSPFSHSIITFFSVLGAKKAREETPKKKEKARKTLSLASGKRRCWNFSPFKSMCCMIYERYNCFQKHYIFIKRRMNECTGKTWVQTSLRWRNGCRNLFRRNFALRRGIRSVVGGLSLFQIAFTSFLPRKNTLPAIPWCMLRNHRSLATSGGIMCVTHTRHIFVWIIWN